MLRHPCILGGPQRQARGAKSEVVPNEGEQKKRWVSHPCLVMGQKQRAWATSPLHSWGSPTKGNKIRSGCLTCAFSGAQKGAKMLRHPCILGVPNAKRGEQHQRWCPTKRNKIRSGCHIIPFSKAQKRLDGLHHPCILGDPQQRGKKTEVWLCDPCHLRGPKEGENATSPLHSWGPSAGSKIRSGAQKMGTKSEVASAPLSYEGPKRGWMGYITLAFLGIPNKGEQNQKWLPHPCLLRGPKEGGCGTSPLHSWGSSTKAEENKNWLPHTYLLGGQKEGKNATSPLHSPGSPTPSAGSNIRSGAQQKGRKSKVAAASLPFQAQKRVDGLHHPCILGDPQQKGTQSEVAASSMPSQKRAKMLRHPCILGGPQRQARGATSEAIPNKGGKIRSGCHILAFSGAQKRVDGLCHPRILGDPQQRGTKSEVAALCMPSRGPKEGENATSPLHSRGSPTPSAGSKIRSGPQQKGTKSEVVATSLPCQGPKERLDGLHHPCILGDPQQRGKKS